MPSVRYLIVVALIMAAVNVLEEFNLDRASNVILLLAQIKRQTSLIESLVHRSLP